MKSSLLLILQLIFISIINAQFAFNYPKTNPAGDFETLFVELPSGNSAEINSIKDLINQNWKASPVIYYSGKPSADQLRSSNLFLNISHNKAEISVVKSIDHPDNSPPGFNHYYFLNFWTIERSYDQSKSIDENMFPVIRAELFPKELLFNEEFAKTGNNNAEMTDISKLEKNYLNGTPGHLKNNIQFVNSHLKDRKNKLLTDDIIPPAEIDKLQNDTLFIPNYWYGPGTSVSDEASPEYKQNVSYLNKLIKSYKYPAKILTREELSTRILNSKAAFYYLNYIQSASDKLVSIINGNSGEVIYSYPIVKAFKLKEKDLALIIEEVK